MTPHSIEALGAGETVRTEPTLVERLRKRARGGGEYIPKYLRELDDLLLEAANHITTQEDIIRKVCEFSITAISWDEGEGLHYLLGEHDCQARHALNSSDAEGKK